MFDVYLICLSQGGPKPVVQIKELWGEHYHLTDPKREELPEGSAEILIIAAERENGGGVLLTRKVYDRIKAAFNDQDFGCLIIPLGDVPLYGYNRSGLWEWINKVTAR